MRRAVVIILFLGSYILFFSCGQPNINSSAESDVFFIDSMKIRTAEYRNLDSLYAIEFNRSDINEIIMQINNTPSELIKFGCPNKLFFFDSTGKEIKFILIKEGSEYFKYNGGVFKLKYPFRLPKGSRKKKIEYKN